MNRPRTMRMIVALAGSVLPAVAMPHPVGANLEHRLRPAFIAGFLHPFAGLLHGAWRGTNRWPAPLAAAGVAVFGQAPLT